MEQEQKFSTRKDLGELIVILNEVLVDFYRVEEHKFGIQQWRSNLEPDITSRIKAF